MGSDAQRPHDANAPRHLVTQAYPSAVFVEPPYTALRDRCGPSIINALFANLIYVGCDTGKRFAMQRLLYISTARAIITQDVIDDILRVSRRNNAAVGVTGLLIVGGKRFLQVLEGTDLAVAQTFDRIQRDPRHFAMVSLARQTITERTFGSWSMGYQAGGNATSGESAAAMAALIAPIDDPMLRGYFTGFVDLHMNAA
jgi:hypothetical protein